MSECSLPYDHPDVGCCAGESAIDPSVQQAGKVQRECRRRRDVVVVEIRGPFNNPSLPLMACWSSRFSCKPPFKRQPQRSIETSEACRVGAPVAETRLQPFG